MSKIRLLTKDELFDNPIQVNKELGIFAKPTELAYLTDCGIKYADAKYYYEDNGEYKVYNPYINAVDFISVRPGIRPVLNLKDIPPFCLEDEQEIIPGVSEFQFGYFPQTIMREDLDISSFEQLECFGRKFTYSFPEKKNDIDNKHYVYISSALSMSPIKIIKFNSSKTYIRIDPITWYADHRAGICVSKNVLIGSIPPEQIKKYLEDFFYQEINQFDPTVIIENNIMPVTNNENQTFDNMVNDASKQMEEILGKSYTKTMR